MGDETDSEVKCVLMLSEGFRNFRDFQNWLGGSRWGEGAVLWREENLCMVILKSRRDRR